MRLATADPPPVVGPVSISPGPVPRDVSVDTLRGLACVLLAAYHVIGDSPDSGLRVTEGPLREANDLLALVRMPLFTILSGFVYAARPFRSGARAFLSGKARRLLLPMLFVGTLFALAQAVTPGASLRVEHWGLLHIVPVAHFWFVEALFWVFLLLVPLERAGALSSPGRAAGVFVASVAVYVFVAPSVGELFAASGALYLFPYFLAGLAFRRFSLTSGWPRGLGWGLVCAIGLALVFVGAEDAPVQFSAAALLVGVGTAAGLLASGWRLPWLARIGAWSYTIYLFHVFFTAGSRILLRRILGIEATAILFPIGVALALAGPILVELAIRRWAPALGLPLLGARFGQSPRLRVLASAPSS